MNKAVARIRELSNALSSAAQKIEKSQTPEMAAALLEGYEILVRLLNPMAPIWPKSYGSCWGISRFWLKPNGLKYKKTFWKAKA